MPPIESTEGSAYAAATDNGVTIRNEDDLIASLGISMSPSPTSTSQSQNQNELPTESEHVVVPDPHADEVDLSDLRGTRAPTTGAERKKAMKDPSGQDDLDALAEIVPALKSQTHQDYDSYTMTVDNAGKPPPNIDGGHYAADNAPIEVTTDDDRKMPPSGVDNKKIAARGFTSSKTRYDTSPPDLVTNDSMQVQKSGELNLDTTQPSRTKTKVSENMSASSPVGNFDDDDDDDDDQNLGGFEDVDSENALESDDEFEVDTRLGAGVKDDPSEVARKPLENANNPSSNMSLSTATQTHEVRMPLYLPTFKPATGCTNASDFVVRCFVARLRSGITVIKHGRSRWCKSRLRILHIHQDGRSLSWKPAVGEPSSSKRPPKLDLSTCTEVRHAWSPDPLNPMFTGTPIMRQKCEAANAHKSFALIFPKRTVDITAVTADQCKVLMEGFSALCFRLQVANLAGRGAKRSTGTRLPDEEEVATTTASVTLTNNSSMSPAAVNNRQKRR